jgi:thioesterase domain-containing protein
VEETHPAEVERYLHGHIPLSRDMGVTVVSYDPVQGVHLAAPLGPNVNHRQTVFGGSAAALATLAAWAVVHFGLRVTDDPERAYRVVVRRSTVEYPAPLAGDFEAYAPAPSAADWSRFVATLRRRGKARLTLSATVTSGGVIGVTFEGEFIALNPDGAS